VVHKSWTFRQYLIVLSVTLFNNFVSDMRPDLPAWYWL